MTTTQLDQSAHVDLVNRLSDTTGLRAVRGSEGGAESRHSGPVN
ncbi:MAG TPA: hypothetical protein VHU85_08230 [Acidimicrobiales bacterium]|nr:hypothetical protein [Acidimicrobiales bacterium]